MRILIEKWGDGGAVRIPASVMAAARLSIGQAVEVSEDGGRIIIDPAYDVDRLLDQMKPETFPEDIDFGRPVGGEMW